MRSPGPVIENAAAPDAAEQRIVDPAPPSYTFLPPHPGGADGYASETV